VFVVDDDEGARDSLCALVSSMGLTAHGYESASKFLREYDANQPGCLVTDYRMAGLSGLDLQQQLIARRIKLPVIMITAYATPSLAVQTMQQGAVTLLEKPCDDQVLAEAIRQALVRDARQRCSDAAREDCIGRLATLSPQERRVMEMMIAGKSNKLMAIELGVGMRTIEARRNRVYFKTKTESMAELIRLVLHAQSGGESS
jgi:FixJ family two-component response regulator